MLTRARARFRSEEGRVTLYTERRLVFQLVFLGLVLAESVYEAASCQQRPVGKARTRDLASLQ